MTYTDDFNLQNDFKYQLVTSEGDGHKVLNKTYGAEVSCKGRIYLTSLAVLRIAQSIGFEFEFGMKVFTTNVSLALNSLVKEVSSGLWFRVEQLLKEPDKYSTLYIYQVVRK